MYECDKVFFSAKKKFLSEASFGFVTIINFVYFPSHIKVAVKKSQVKHYAKTYDSLRVFKPCFLRNGELIL